MHQDPFLQKESYDDSPLDKFMVSYFAERMSQQLGGECFPSSETTFSRLLHAATLQCCINWTFLCGTGREYAPGYEGFVELSREMMKGRNSKQQQQAVSGVLGSLMPPEAAERFRKWFPVSKVPAFMEPVRHSQVQCINVCQ